MNKPEWLVFDLGGVLMNFDGVAELSRLTGKSQQWCHDTLISSRALFDFEVGKSSPIEFAERFVSELKLPLSAEEMLELWTNWEAGPKPGALEYVRSLQSSWRMACLSNTSVTHWERLCGRHGVHTLFELRVYCRAEQADW